MFTDNLDRACLRIKLEKNTSAQCRHNAVVRLAGEREPWGQGDPPPEIYLGGQTWYFDPHIFLVKSIFWYTPTRCY